jgi:LmbE family N-acetylglucosaminyl deacetylase
VLAALLATGSRRAHGDPLPVSDTVPPHVLPEVQLNADDRILILAPHPDDEVLGCGGVIQKAVAMKLPVRVVFLTYGDNNEWSFLLYRKHPVLFPQAVQAMGQVRRDEALAADKALGLAPEQLTFLGYPDFGTLAIWYEHWASASPYRAMLTRATSVPYANALRSGAPYKGEEVLRDLTAILREFRPTKVFVSHPGDHNGDHSALYLFTRVALWDLQKEFSPTLYPYLIHLPHWPRVTGLRPNEPLEVPTALGAQVAWSNYRLTPSQVDRKHQALQAHRSQHDSSARYLMSFVRGNELFGDFPDMPIYHGLTFHGEKTPVEMAEPPEELTADECAAYCAIDWNFIRVENHELTVSVRLSHPLDNGVLASIYAFGYRADRPFAEMPKVHVRLGEFTHAAVDLDRRLRGDEITVIHQPMVITVRLPLKTLGNPDRLLIGARTYQGEVPLDWVAWRVLELKRDKPIITAQ